MAVEIEDDVFFADLSKQIALLIMDDDELEFPVENPPVLHVQGFHHLSQAIMPSPYTYEMTSYRRESKGTGVFIPRSPLPRRKNRARKSTSNNNTSQRENNKSGTAISHATNDNKLQYSSYYTNSGTALKN